MVKEFFVNIVVGDFRSRLLAFLWASVEPLPPLRSVQGLDCLAFPRESSSLPLQSAIA